MIMANYLDYLLSKQKWNLLINNEEHLLYVQTIDESSYIEVKKKTRRMDRGFRTR